MRVLPFLLLSTALSLAACSGEEQASTPEQASTVIEQSVAVENSNVSTPKPAPGQKPVAYESEACPLPDKFKGYTAETWCREKGYKDKEPHNYVRACMLGAIQANDADTQFITKYDKECSSLRTLKHVECDCAAFMKRNLPQ